jgi:hypothetical protein
MGRDKTGRNDPCPCGSGLKYKRCCLLSAAPAAAYTQEERLSARAALDDFLDRGGWEAIESEAMDEFWGPFAFDLGEGELSEEMIQQSESVFLPWLWFDYQSRMDDAWWIAFSTACGGFLPASGGIWNECGTPRSAFTRSRRSCPARPSPSATC